jgi:NTE family protein
MTSGLLASLDPADREALIAAGTTRALDPGEYLVRQQAAGDAAFVVESGLLEVVLDTDGRETVVSTLGPGEIVGEMALLSGEPRSASVRAVTAARVLVLSRELFDAFMREHAAALLEISRVLSRRLSATDAQLGRPAAGLSALLFDDVGAVADDLVAATIADITELVNGAAAIVPLGEEAEPLATLERIAELRRRNAHVVLTLTPSALERQWPAVRAAERVVVVGSTRAAERVDQLRGQLTARGAGDIRVALVGDGPWTLPRRGVPDAQAIRVRLDGNAAAGRDAIRGDGSAALARALTRRTIGLALSSGAAQGLAHVGVLDGLLRAGITPDVISGTSGGALYGSMIAAGVPIDRVRAHLVHHTRRNLNDRLDLTLPRAGLIRGEKLVGILTDLIGDVRFDELRIPLCAVAADLDTGAEVPLDCGVVHRAVRASISIPGVFVPARVDGRTLIDGAVVNPLPVSVARRMGADIVIAVQVPAPGNVADAQARARGAPRRRHHLVSTLMRSYYFASDALASVAAEDADVLIKPDVARFGWRDYRSAAAIMDAGRDAAAAAVDVVRQATPR